MAAIAKSVLIYLGIPFIAGMLIRFVMQKVKGRQWYEKEFYAEDQHTYVDLPVVHDRGDVQPKGRDDRPLLFDVVRVAIPLTIYFVVMFFASFWMSKKAGANYPCPGPSSPF